MTGVALISARNVRCALAAGDDAIVANDTGLTGGAVIKTADGPIGHRVTRIAGQHRGQVIYPFAGGNDTVVTTFADTQHPFMINGGYR